MTHNIKITEAAAEQIFRWTDSQDDVVGARLAFKKAGCAGYRVEIEPAKHHYGADDVVIQFEGAFLFVAKKAIPHLKGTLVDFGRVDNGKPLSLAQTGFKLSIPEAKEACGCGETYGFDETITVQAPNLSFGKG